MSKKPDWKLHPESAMMSFGYESDWSEGAVTPPIFHSTTYAFENAEEGEECFRHPAQESTLIYSRLNHPNAEFFEKRLPLWEGAESCAVFTSGMAAIFTLCSEFLDPEDALIYSNPLYGGTSHLFDVTLPQKMRINAFPFNSGNIEEALLKVECRGLRTKMIFIETPANPTNGLVDIQRCSKAANNYLMRNYPRPIIVIDNTLLGPIYQHPLKHGADISIYSATKYISGHSNVIAGACVGSRENIDRLKKSRIYLGNTLSPDSCARLAENMQTLQLRMHRQFRNAFTVAKYLKTHPNIEKVYYLGLLKAGDRDFNVYKKQCLGPGGLVSFDIKGSKQAAFKFLNSLKLFGLAVSLGSNESLAQHPYTMTHAGVPPEEKQKLGITEKMVRLSIGIENPKDLIRDLEQALALT